MLAASAPTYAGSSWYWFTVRSSGIQRRRWRIELSPSNVEAVVLAAYWG